MRRGGAVGEGAWSVSKFSSVRQGMFLPLHSHTHGDAWLTYMFTEQVSKPPVLSSSPSANGTEREGKSHIASNTAGIGCAEAGEWMTLVARSPPTVEQNVVNEKIGNI